MNSHNKGFSLIELMVVIAIVGILNGGELGIPGSNIFATMTCLLAHKNGTVDTKCFYSYTRVQSGAFTPTSIAGIQTMNASVASTGNIAPGMINAEGNLLTYVTAFYNGATCM